MLVPFANSITFQHIFNVTNSCCFHVKPTLEFLLFLHKINVSNICLSNVQVWCRFYCKIHQICRYFQCWRGLRTNPTLNQSILPAGLIIPDVMCTLPDTCKYHTPNIDILWWHSGRGSVVECWTGSQEVAGAMRGQGPVVFPRTENICITYVSVDSDECEGMGLRVARRHVNDPQSHPSP